MFCCVSFEISIHIRRENFLYTGRFTALSSITSANGFNIKWQRPRESRLPLPYSSLAHPQSLDLLVPLISGVDRSSSTKCFGFPGQSSLTTSLPPKPRPLRPWQHEI